MGIKEEPRSEMQACLDRFADSCRAGRYKGQVKGELLYLYPIHPPAAQPVIDNFTKKMTAAFRSSMFGDGPYMGHHTCSCGACSDSSEHVLPNRIQTNSLCIHYLAWHRDEVPRDVLDYIGTLPYGEAEPRESELAPPEPGHFDPVDDPGMVDVEALLRFVGDSLRQKLQEPINWD